METRNLCRGGLTAVALAIGLGIWWSQRDPSDPRRADMAEEARSAEPPAFEVQAGEVPVAEVQVGEVEVGVSVFDSRGYEQRDVAVWLEAQDKRSLWSAWSDDEGRCTLRAPSNTQLATVRARARDGRAGRAAFDPRASTLQIVIPARPPPPYPLRGQLTIDGAPAGAGFDVVLALDAQLATSTEAVARALSGEQVTGLLATTSDATGAFAFEADDPYTSRLIYAGGRGWSTAGFVHNRVGEDAQIPLLQIYGAILRLTDGDGPAAVSAAAPTMGVREGPVRLAEGTQVKLDDVALLLAGMPRDALAVSRTSRRVLVASNSTAPRIGPNFARLELFGYEPLDLAFDVTPLASGLLEVDAPLQRTTESNATGSFGGVLVRAVDVSPELAAALERRDGAGAGELVLRSAENELFRFNCELSARFSTAIEYVPRGEFRAQFHSRSGGVVAAPQPVLVKPGWCDLGLSLRGAGGVELVFASRARGEGLKPFAAELRGVPDGAADPALAEIVSEVRIRRSPHMVAPLAAGAYELLEPRLLQGGVAGKVRFRVEPGAVTRLEIERGQ
jgi:hypothetical protein